LSYLINSTFTTIIETSCTNEFENEMFNHGQWLRMNGKKFEYFNREMAEGMTQTIITVLLDELIK